MALNEIKLKFFADYIEKELGIVYSPQVYFQLDQRIDKIAQYLGVPSSEDVYAKAQKVGITGDFKQFLLDTATNNETSFFRDPKIFQAIETRVLPALAAQPGKSFNYRIWCAAASFGQEPYSVAMLVYEFLKKNPGHPRIEIIATDIADHALARCKAARYSQLEIQRGLSIHRMMEYFTKVDNDQWQLKPEISSLVEFKKQNLLEPFNSLGTFNIILVTSPAQIDGSAIHSIRWLKPYVI